MLPPGSYCIRYSGEAFGEEGVLIPRQNLCNGLADKMNDIIQNPEKRDLYGPENSDQVLKNFIWDRITDKYVDGI